MQQRIIHINLASKYDQFDKNKQLNNEQNDNKKLSKQAIIYLLQKSKKESQNTNK